MLPVSESKSAPLLLNIRLKKKSGEEKCREERSGGGGGGAERRGGGGGGEDRGREILKRGLARKGS